MFNRARLKLTAIYTVIIAIISLLFSVIIALTASNAISQPANSPRDLFSHGYTQDIEDLFQERAADAQGQLVAALIFTNIVIVAAGATGSYFLAKWTLKPIEEAMENQARFVSDASHELKTPLAAIIMENEVTLRDKKVSREELKEQIQSNLDEVGKLRYLAEYLLKLAQDRKLELGDVDLKEAADIAIDRAAKIALAKKIRVVNNANSFKVHANKDALTEMLAILLDNAIKYSPAETQVSVSNDREVIMVSDEGPGVAAKDLPHIFERFYRADKSRTSEGNGLGLALAKNLADKMGARIAATNNKQKGATFAVKFSAKSQSEATK